MKGGCLAVLIGFAQKLKVTARCCALKIYCALHAALQAELLGKAVLIPTFEFIKQADSRLHCSFSVTDTIRDT